MTEAELTTRLAAYLSAETAILSGAQEYTIGQGSTARRVVRADLEQIRTVIAEIRAEISVLSGACNRRVLYLRPFN